MPRTDIRQAFSRMAQVQGQSQGGFLSGLNQGLAMMIQVLQRKKEQEAEAKARKEESDRNFELRLQQLGISQEDLKLRKEDARAGMIEREKVETQRKAKNEMAELARPYLDELDQLTKQFDEAQTPAERRKFAGQIWAKEQRIHALDPEALSKSFFDNPVVPELIKEPEGPSAAEQKLYEERLRQRELAILSGLFQEAARTGGAEAVSDLAWNGSDDEFTQSLINNHRTDPEFKRLVEQWASEASAPDLRTPTQTEIESAIEDYKNLVPAEITKESNFGLDILGKDTRKKVADFGAAPRFIEGSPDSARVFIEGVRRLKSGEYDATDPDERRTAFNAARNDYELLSGKGTVPISDKEVAKAYARQVADQMKATDEEIGFDTIPFSAIPSIQIKLLDALDDDAELVGQILEILMNDASVWE